MFLLVVCPLVLILDTLLFLSLRGQSNSPRELSRPTCNEWVIYGALVVLAQIPLLGLLPLGSTPAVLWGDAESHARAGLDIARFGLRSGWLDGRLAGFPFAQHYPPLGWLLHAAAVKVGAPPIRAMQWLGFLFIAATPLTLFYCLGSAPRIRLSEAALAGVFVSWVSPYNPFFGGYEAFFHTGLLSQTLGVPLVLLWIREVCLGRRSVALGAYSVLAMAAHPQVCIAGVVLSGLGLLGFGALSRFRTFCWATLFLGAAGLALYGQGVLGMRLPFGWPAEFGWRQQGFAPSRLSWWLIDGSLFDRSSAGALTQLVILAFALSFSRIRRPRVRAAALTFAVGLLLSVSGSLLREIGPVGEFLLKFVQPLRLVSLIPASGAALVAIVAGAVADDVGAFFDRTRRQRWGTIAHFAIHLSVLGTCMTGIPARMDFVHTWQSSFRQIAVPQGYKREVVSSWLSEKRKGRLWYSAKSRLVPLFLKDALSLQTESALANTGAVGGHVGLHLAAFGHLAPEDSGASKRAEALGIRSLLLVDTPTPPDFRVVHQKGALRLVEHSRPSNLLGTGCIVRSYEGSNASLMNRMVTDVKHPDSRNKLLDPNHLTQIIFGKDAVQEVAVAKGECDSENVRIHEGRYSSGHIEGTIENPKPFDLVIRVASFPSWRVLLDGRKAEWTAVAPGFVSVRVPPGNHKLVADAGVWSNMVGTLTLGLTLMLGLILLRDRRPFVEKKRNQAT